MTGRLTNPRLDPYGDATLKHNVSILDVLKKLKEYEDTDLTPEQVREMQNSGVYRNLGDERKGG